MGVPVCNHSYLLGNNNSVVGSSTTPDTKLSKRHVMLSFHEVREAIASGMVRFHFLHGGDTNSADILSNHLTNASVWQQLRTFLHWKGNTADLFA